MSTRFATHHPFVVCDADQVPAGKIIRCWLPYAMEIPERQECRTRFDFAAQRIVSANDGPSPHDLPEQTAVAGKRPILQCRLR